MLRAGCSRTTKSSATGAVGVTRHCEHAKRHQPHASKHVTVLRPSPQTKPQLGSPTGARGGQPRLPLHTTRGEARQRVYMHTSVQEGRLTHGPRHTPETSVLHGAKKQVVHHLFSGTSWSLKKGGGCGATGHPTRPWDPSNISVARETHRGQRAEGTAPGGGDKALSAMETPARVPVKNQPRPLKSAHDSRVTGTAKARSSGARC